MIEQGFFHQNDGAESHKRTGYFRSRAKPELRLVPDPRVHLLAGSITVVGTPMRFAGKAEIYGEGEPADYLYQVLSGTVRTSKILVDGRRQIGGFYLPDDIFGLEPGDEHAYSAEAIVESRVLVIK